MNSNRPSSLTLQALDETVIAAAADGSEAVDAAIGGKQVGQRYRLDKLLGSGAFGAVFRAIDELSGDAVAVKLIRGLDDDTLSTVRRETATLRLLRLPGVVSLLDEGSDGDRHFLVTELVTGAHFPGVPAPATWDQLREPTLGLLEALARVHAAGVVHRDLKPANVLVGDDGNVTLIDFGVATAPEYTGTELAIRGTAGTPLYIAPEQAKGGIATMRTDLYCLGVMLYEALSGRLPHEQHDVRRLLEAKTRLPAPPLADVAPGTPEIVCDVVDQLLQTHSTRRPISAWHVLRALRGLEVDDPVSTMLSPWAGGSISRDDLRVLVSGHESFLRIPSDTAAELELRTDGRADVVVERLRSWQRARLARVEDGRLHIDRAAIDRFRAGLRVAPDLPPGDDVAGALTDDERNLLCWAEIAWPNATAQVLEPATGWDPDRLIEARDGLIRRELMRRASRGRWLPRGGWLLQQHWSADQTREAHSAVARSLPRGTPGRLLHLLRAGMSDSVVPESLAVHETHLAAGERNMAIEVLREGLSWARAAERDEAELLEAAVAVACLHAEPRVIDRVMHLVHTSSRSSVDIHRLLDLCRGMLLSYGGDHQRALAIADALGPLTNPHLERWRLVIYAQEARMRGPEGHREQFEYFDDLHRDGHPRVRSMIDVWHARVLYDEHRFEDALQVELELLARAETRIERMGRQHGAAFALLACGRCEEAREHARAASREAAAARDTFIEVLCCAVTLSAGYKLGEDQAWTDEELAAVLHAVRPVHIMDGLLTCVAIAARRGNIGRARDVVRRIAEAAHTMHRSSLVAFVRAMEPFFGITDPSALDVDAMLQVASAAEIPGVDAQTAHMVRAMCPDRADAATELLRQCLERLPPSTPDGRREVFTMSELRGDTPSAAACRERWLAGLGDP